MVVVVPGSGSGRGRRGRPGRRGGGGGGGRRRRPAQPEFARRLTVEHSTHTHTISAEGHGAQALFDQTAARRNICFTLCKFLQLLRNYVFTEARPQCFCI